MNGTITPDRIDKTMTAQAIVTVRNQVDQLVREHDAILSSILEDARESPNTQLNLFKMLEVICQQSDMLSLLDRRLRLMEDAIAPETEVIWAVGCD